jgi:bla regulator protein blaR1
MEGGRMIAHWMLYCVAVGLLLGGGAAALERALAAFGRPTRWPWAAALLLTLAVPAAARFLPRSADTASLLPIVVVSSSAPADPGTPIPEIGTPGTEAPRRDPRPALSLPSLDLSALDGPLLVFWRVSSSVAVGVLAGLAIVLERRRRRWRAAKVDGVLVLVSPDTGPAVVGVLRTRIVLPEWACVVDEGARALLLEHEREHVRAGDARLLAGGLLALALMPWNPALWWQLRRLRLAVEVDCAACAWRWRWTATPACCAAAATCARTARFSWKSGGARRGAAWPPRASPSPSPSSNGGSGR